MSNVMLFIPLGSLSALGTVFGFSWELIFGMVGTLMSLYALIKAEVSEQLLKSIAGDVRDLAALREELRERLTPGGRLARLLRCLFRRSSRKPPEDRS